MPAAEPPIIYQSKSGKIEFSSDLKGENIWATQKQISSVFDIDRSVVTRHINNIFKSNEVDKKSNVQKMHIANSDKPVQFYSLDIILAVGYRTNSARAIKFRIWATQTLRQHLLDGYTINKSQLAKNYKRFQKALKEVQAVLPKGGEVGAKDVLGLVNLFAGTWFSLDAYDTEKFPLRGNTKRKVRVTATELSGALVTLKKTLLRKKQATAIFGQERSSGSVEGIIGNVYQSFGGQDVYPTLEEKAAHILYFVVKNHPFVDGNKRSGAFAFVWFLQRVGLLRAGLSPEALTTLTILVAESKPKDKEKIIGIILLLLKR